jgi:hypothetical protein
VTPAQIETAARRKYNSTSSSFFATAEIYDLIYQAELEIAEETKVIEVTALVSGGSIDGTRAYAIPTTISEVKRVEYDGRKLTKIDFDQDDVLTLFDSNTTVEGEPFQFSEWGGSLYLRPIPDTSSLQIRVYGFGLPAEVTSPSQVLEVPAIFHMKIVDRVVGEMAMKDSNTAIGSQYISLWYEHHLPKIKAWYSKKKSASGFRVVKDVESLSNIGDL